MRRDPGGQAAGSSEAAQRDGLSTPGHWRRRWNAWGGTSIVGVLAFFALWQLVIVVFEVPRYILPAPTAIFRQFVRNFPMIWKYTLITAAKPALPYPIPPAPPVPPPLPP